jgi:hypothetical protein
MSLATARWISVAMVMQWWCNRRHGWFWWWEARRAGLGEAQGWDDPTVKSWWAKVEQAWRISLAIRRCTAATELRKERRWPPAVRYIGRGWSIEVASSCFGIAMRTATCPHTHRRLTKAAAIGDETGRILPAVCTVASDREPSSFLFSQFQTWTRLSPKKTKVVHLDEISNVAYRLIP